MTIAVIDTGLAPSTVDRSLSGHPITLVYEFSGAGVE